jgi:transketolase
VAVEAGVPDGWYKYVGRGGLVVGIDRFGESAPADAVYRELGITAERVVAAVRRLLR